MIVCFWSAFDPSELFHMFAMMREVCTDQQDTIKKLVEKVSSMSTRIQELEGRRISIVRDLASVKADSSVVSCFTVTVTHQVRDTSLEISARRVVPATLAKASGKKRDI